MKTHKAVLALSLAAMVVGLLAPAAVMADPGRQGAPASTAAGISHGPGVVPFPAQRPSPRSALHRPFVPRFP